MLSTGTSAKSCCASVDAEESHKVEVEGWILRGLEGRRRVRVWGRGEEIGGAGGEGGGGGGGWGGVV